MANTVSTSGNDENAIVSISTDPETVVVSTDPQTAVITQEGGPQGIAGADAADKHYVHTQGAAAQSWTITHNLGKMPAVEVVDTGNNIVIGDVEYISLNQIRVNFTSAFTGKAYIN